MFFAATDSANKRRTLKLTHSIGISVHILGQPYRVCLNYSKVSGGATAVN